MWFKRKLYGWGWYPATWQGWLVTLAYVGLVLLFAFTVDENSSNREIVFTCIMPTVLLTITFIRVLYKKGEKPRWQWGKDKGFTLIELLVVISIIALLSSVVLAQLNLAREKGRLGAARGFAAQAFHVAADQAAGIWDLDEGSGTAAVDRSGGGHNGTLTNMVPTWSSNTYSGTGFSVFFDGSNDYIEVPYDPDLAPTSAVSFGAWFNASSLSGGRQILSKTQVGGYQLSINENSACATATLCALVNIGGSYHSASYPLSNMSTGKWYYALGTYDGETVRLYLDGKEVASNSTPSGAVTYSTNNSLCIGAEPNITCTDGIYFSGFIDEVRVFGKALTALEVLNQYASGLRRLGIKK